jgi:hypothetical protein
MKLLPVILCLIICATVIVSAQDTLSIMKLDSISTYQNKYTENPLANKTFGIEFNPIRLLLGWTTDAIGEYNYTHLSGGVSLFAVDRHAEIAFPFLLVFGTFENIPYRILNIDATYRRFTSASQKGFYFSAGLRYAYVSGEEGKEYSIKENREEAIAAGTRTGKQIVQSKAGIYIGIGYRYFSESGWYWGTNILVGYFFPKADRHIIDVKMDDLKFILDGEILKIGYAF